MMNLFLPGGHLHFRPAIDDIGVIRAQAQRRPDRVHGHIAAADDGDVVPADDGRVIFGEKIGLHQIGPGQIFIG